MAEVVANTAFTHAGIQVRVGDVIDSGHVLYVVFPARFTARYSGASTVVGTIGTAAGTLGSLIAKQPVLDGNGTIVGYSPLYDTIVP